MTWLDRWAMNLKRSCLTKKRYKTPAQAKKVAEKVFKERGVKLYCYWCNQCGSYHLTSRHPKSKKEDKERIF